MQVFFWVAFLVVVGVAFFAIQNSSAPPVMIKFIIWRFETSLVYTLLGSIGLGIVLTLLFWVPRAIRTYFRKRSLQKETERKGHGDNYPTGSL